MALVTLRVLDGADRGRVFEDLPTPITIGREEGNTVQLNDERVSRFHVKIQQDRDKLVLTDLQSTNGTKVNGENVQLALLRQGDLVSVGRTLLLVGSREDIAARLAQLRGVDIGADDEEEGTGHRFSLDFELQWADHPDAQAILHALVPPELPDGLSPGQAAQLAELLQFFLLRFRGLVQTVRTNPKSDRVTLEQRQWQNILDLYDQVAVYLRMIGEPAD